MQFTHHIPVMLNEVLQFWGQIMGGSYVDATFGRGGHTRALLERNPSAQLWVCDRDQAALSAPVADSLQNGYKLHCNYSELHKKLAPASIDGILADLGLCSGQLDNPERGFSFRQNGPLDMRMDLNSSLSLWTYLQAINEESLANDIFQYGEEKRSRPIAKEILTRFRTQQLKTTADLVECVTKFVKHKPGEKHPATRTFQALRMAVNQELQHLDVFLKNAPLLLKPEGLLSIITFHSLEYTHVKEAYQNQILQLQFEVQGFQMKRLSHPLFPSELEQSENPRARSARLHVYQKIARK